ncbi:MAG: leucine-rich repeat protein, partial [Clostridia bacterium]|nr:leucine-rich repeat protein [Clostridia bacterium]
MALKTVRYGGLRAQWDDVSVAASNDFLTRATFSYLHKTGGFYGSNLGWILDGERNLLIITGSGDGPSQAEGPWLNWAPYIQTIKVEGAASIWDEAFRECTGVTKVYLPDSLTYVGDGAFADCTEITDVYYEGTSDDWDEITIRPYNDPLTHAELHTEPHQEQLTGDLSWSVDDEGLLRIWIDDDLVGDGEDTNIPDFASYSDAPWYEKYHDRIFSLCIEEGVTGIGKNAFRNLQELYTVDIAPSVTYIGNTAFYNCSMLQETLTLPYGIESIGANAFTNCTNTEILILPDSVTTIGAGAFRGCSALYKVMLPAQLQVIPQNCFLNCTRLESIEIPATVTTVGSYAFNDCYALARQQGSVYYGGTSVQWNDIDVKNNNSYLLNAAAYHFTPEELAVNAANFPDTNFRSYVAQSFNTDGVLVNGVAYLSEAEIAATELEMDNEGDVTSIQGIEYLTELTYLNLQGVPGLSYADLRQNTALTEVSIGGSLTEIRLDGLKYLQKLYLGDNQLAELDLDGLTNLTQLSVYGNQLTALDVSSFALTRLDVENTPLTELVLGQQPSWSTLYCYGTQLKELDL